MVVAVKSLHNSSNSNPNYPHAFMHSKKNSRSSTVPYLLLLGNSLAKQEYWKSYSKWSHQHWDDYCRLTAAARLVWEEKAEALNKAMLLLLHSKNNNAKKDLRLAYSQGN